MLEFLKKFAQNIAEMILLNLFFAAILAPMIAVIFFDCSPWWLALYIPIVSLLCTISEEEDSQPEQSMKPENKGEGDTDGV